MFCSETIRKSAAGKVALFFNFQFALCVRDWSGILLEPKLEAETEAEARKDIAESPTAEL